MRSYCSHNNNYWLSYSECVIIITRGLPGVQRNHLILGPREFHWHCRPPVAYGCSLYHECMFEGVREREGERGGREGRGE